MNFDIEEFKEKFIEDATELLIQLETDLLLLEKDKGNTELAESVFRAMHTLKGVAGMYGFDNIVEFTHRLENIYDAIRSKSIGLSQEIFNITFKSVDHLKKLLQDHEFLNEENKNQHSILLTEMKKIFSDKDLIELAERTPNEVAKLQPNDNKEISTFYILFKTDENFIKRGIKIISIFNELSQLGTYRIIEKLKTDPIAPKLNEEYWPIFLTTAASQAEIEDVFMFVLDNCSVTKICDFDLFNSPVKFEDGKMDKQTILEKVNYYNQNQNIVPETSKELDLEVQLADLDDKADVDESIKENASTSQTKKINRIAVDAAKLDHLMYLVGELITVNSQLVLSTRNKYFESIRPYLEQVDKLSKNFRNNALDLRLVPIKDMVFRFNRLIRDLSNQLGKEVEFQIQGEDTELDKSTIDTIADPLMHIIRNCIDHGIEMPDERKAKEKAPIGQINFFAYHQGNNVFINIQDDGKGIDTETIRKKAIEKGIIKETDKLSKQELYQLIFLPGFSTAQNLTNVSGRGVGMDVVKRKIAEIRGEVEITSEPNLGTSFTIKLQQSISILDTMLIIVADMYLMIPLSDVEFCGVQTIEEIEDRKYAGTLEYEKKLIPFIDLREVFDIVDENSNDNSGKRRSVIINKQDMKIALIADKIIGEHQAVLKPLGDTFKDQKLFTSASVLADGEMAFMLNTIALQKTLVNNNL